LKSGCALAQALFLQGISEKRAKRRFSFAVAWAIASQLSPTDEQPRLPLLLRLESVGPKHIQETSGGDFGGD
jgi:hypothetical protein